MTLPPYRGSVRSLRKPRTLTTEAPYEDYGSPVRSLLEPRSKTTGAQYRRRADERRARTPLTDWNKNRIAIRAIGTCRGTMAVIVKKNAT